MEIGFLIPTYLLIISAYGWWLYSRIVWFDMFNNSDMVFYLWLAITVYFHIGLIRTINSRYGYTKETFTVKNFYGQWALNLLGFPLVFLDWKWARGFSFYIAQTWNRFWIVLMLIKILAIVSVWVVLGYFLDVKNDQKIVSVFFVICFTVIAFINHPWIMKIWYLLVYFVPFIVYIIVKIIIYPFTFWTWCLACWKCCKKSEESEEYDSRSNRSDVAHEGGDEEESGFPEDINNLDSARGFEPKIKKKKVKKAKGKAKSKPKASKSDRSKNYLESDIEKGDQSQPNEHLDTNTPIDDKSDKKKKIKRSKSKEKPNEQGKQKEDDKNKVKKGDRDTKDLDSLNFFSRGWRWLKARYCIKCDRMIKVHHPEFQWDIGHYLHVKCAKVKWIGNNVWPIWVKEPTSKPIEVTTHSRRIEAPVEEEIEESEHAEIPMKPNML